jgi:hypothetical protein
MAATTRKATTVSGGANLELNIASWDYGISVPPRN